MDTNDMNTPNSSHNPFDSSTPPPRPSRTPQPTPPTPRRAPRDSQADRELFGFDDIPIDVDDVPFTQLVRAWLKRGVRHSNLEKVGGRLKRLSGKSHLRDIKNDVKWALAADLDEDELTTPAPKSATPTPARRTAAHHTTTSAAPPAPPQATGPRQVDININFGELPKLPKVSRERLAQKLTALHRPSWKTTGIVSALLVVAVAGWATYYFWPASYVTLPDGDKVRKDSAELKEKLPQFGTVTPEGKDIRKLGGWARVSPPEASPVFAFTDTIDGVKLVVSQQELPSNLSSDEKIAELAKAYGANDKQRIGGTDVHIGTSAEGPQSIIAVRGNLLILIKTDGQVSQEKILNYVDTLK